MASQTLPQPQPADALTKDSLALGRAPNLVLSEAHKAAKALAKIIEAKPRKIILSGKTYLQFEDWQTLGRFYGVTAIVRETKYVEYGEGDNLVRGFEAHADALLVSNNQSISSAEALCLNDEANWQSKPLFQLKSMAQTRACAKALRNVLAWVVVLAGYAPTPAEEMSDDVSFTTPTANFKGKKIQEYQIRAWHAACEEKHKTVTQQAEYLRTKFRAESITELTPDEFVYAIRWAMGTEALAETLANSVAATKAKPRKGPQPISQILDEVPADEMTGD